MFRACSNSDERIGYRWESQKERDYWEDKIYMYGQ
jgi:hypothetical protein